MAPNKDEDNRIEKPVTVHADSGELSGDQQSDRSETSLSDGDFVDIEQEPFRWLWQQEEEEEEEDEARREEARREEELSEAYERFLELATAHRNLSRSLWNPIANINTSPVELAILVGVAMITVPYWMCQQSTWECLAEVAFFRYICAIAFAATLVFTRTFHSQYVRVDDAIQWAHSHKKHWGKDYSPGRKHLHPRDRASGRVWFFCMMMANTAGMVWFYGFAHQFFGETLLKEWNDTAIGPRMSPYCFITGGDARSFYFSRSGKALANITKSRGPGSTQLQLHRTGPDDYMFHLDYGDLTWYLQVLNTTNAQ
ncbi:MAG: hypothetical protein Q9162_003526 [Coniocarpon cinnabarinum]